jgi:ARG/rhodanese/phosphatase superfamily protein
VEGAAGMAVAIGKKIVAMDLFDKPATCRKVWDRLMSGYVLDALEGQAEEQQADVADVEQLLQTANGLDWKRADSVGEGEEYRAQRGEEVHASALAWQDAPVHVSVVVAG